MFKKYKATKQNLILLETAMKELGCPVEIKAETDYRNFKYFNWHLMYRDTMNEKMQELEMVVQK